MLRIQVLYRLPTNSSLACQSPGLAMKHSGLLYTESFELGQPDTLSWQEDALEEAFSFILLLPFNLISYQQDF